MRITRIALFVDRRVVQAAMPLARDAVECHRDVRRMFERSDALELDDFEANALWRCATDVCTAVSDAVTSAFHPIIAFDPEMQVPLSEVGLLGALEAQTLAEVEAGIVTRLDLTCRTLEKSLTECTEEPSPDHDEALREASAEVVDQEDPRGQRLQVALLRSLCRLALDGSFSKPARRLLLRLTSDLAWSPHAGIVEMVRECLPVLLACTSEDTALAYRELWDAGVFRRDDDFHFIVPGGLTLRFVLPDRESPRPEVPFREEPFGAPASFVPGKWPQECDIVLDIPPAVTKPLERWAPEQVVDLRHHLQEHLGDHAYITEIWFDEEEKPPGLTIDLWLPRDASPDTLRAQLTPLTRKWLEARFTA